MPTNIRMLTAADAAGYHQLRIRSLREHPEAFGMAAEEEEATSLEEAAAKYLQVPESPTFGAFRDGRLVGIANLWRNPRIKSRHRAMLTGMYVAPEVRGSGLGQALVDAVLKFARSSDGLEDVVLAVTVGNEAARHLYLKAGFTSHSIEPRYIKVDNRYFDVEWMILRIREHG